MLDPERDNIYNIILSLFLGVSVIMIIDFFHDSPRTVTLISDRHEPFSSKCMSSDSNRAIEPFE